LTAKHSSDRVAVSKVYVADGYVFSETSNVRVLDLWMVKIIEIVKDDDFMPRTEQLLGKMRPDKAGAASNQNSHGGQLATDKRGWTQISQPDTYANRAFTAMHLRLNRSLTPRFSKVPSSSCHTRTAEAVPIVPMSLHTR